MKRLHYFSGLTISFFVALHLFNHLYSLFGAEAHIELMNQLRVYYRNVFVEIILLCAVVIQIISGIKLFFKRRKTTSNVFERLQIWTGLYLAFFLIFHIGAIMVGRFLLHLDTNFYFGVAGLNTFPINLFFIPYYSLAIISFFGHISAIHMKKMKTTILGFTPKKQSVMILLIGIILTIILMYGLTNGFMGVKIPKGYNFLIEK
ncbi:hypothetical protein [Winogradskyella sp.]|uniref:hypothetical protein n=1 Tax=Winogradskyella sp. TaxID=1883156 RepID=UPI003AB195C3